MNINEFVAKKIGEVLAFTRVSTDTITRGHTALLEVLGEEKVQDILDKNRLHSEELLHIATEASVLDIVNAKAEKTQDKLTKMRDLYVGDEWDNPTELLEWSGFFEGAAIVHWSLVRGSATGLENEELIMLSQEAVDYHYQLLEQSESELESTGQNRAII